MESREFPNKFPEYCGQALLNSEGKIADDLGSKLHSEIAKLLQHLYEGLDSDEVDDRDYSVYTGWAGIALLHLRMYEVLDGGQNNRHLRKALSYVERPLRHLKRKRVTFLCGDAGVLAIAAVLYHKLGNRQKSEVCVDKLLFQHREVLEDRNLPDEFLFGRVGYLFSLLFLQHHLGRASVSDHYVEEICQRVIQSGEELARQNTQCPLMYEWHEKKYLGAAHGLVGIFHVLLSVDLDARYKDMVAELIRPCIDHLMTLRFPSGNYPSSIGSSTGDKLVHWCHGAPGWLHMFVAAYKAFEDPRYLDAAKSCGEVIWSRGLLRKGYGICHGVAGNAYGFLRLYRLTREDKHLYRACKFSEWCFDYGKHGCRRPDRPYSLYEGLAGTIYFLVDLLEPANAKFPAWEL